MKKGYLPLLILSLISFTNSYAQHEGSAFTASGRGAATTFVTDYHALGINPANLGWAMGFEDKKITFGLAEMSYSFHSSALSKQELRTNIWNGIKGNPEDFTRQEKVDAARDFAESGFALNADIGAFGISFNHEKFGGIAFGVKDRFQWNSVLNKEMSEILFLGNSAPYFDTLLIADGIDTTAIFNSPDLTQDTLDLIIKGINSFPRMMSDIIDGSSISMSWTREYNLSYGRKLFEADSVFALFVGAGVKYIQGFALLNITTESGNLEAFSSLSPVFGVDYGAGIPDPSGPLPEGVGSGFGFDFGLNAILYNRIKIGIAATNIGSVTWSGNVFSVKDTLLYDTESGGLNNYNMVGAVDDFVGKDGLLEWNEEEEKTVSLPTAVRGGLSFKIKDLAQIGADVIIPTNSVPGSFDNAIIGVGADIKPIVWLTLSGGVITGGNYDLLIPVGLTISVAGGTYEAGIASRDALTFFLKEGPTLSVSTGFLRFRF